jgi:tRNA(His) guanylyltransferase
MSDDFGDRMKAYEMAETGRYFMPLVPIYARIDGRCFSAFTRGLARPFDVRMSRAMVETAKFLVEETHARIGYTQSDEISLVWQQERHDSEVLFNGKVHKLTSVLAALATVRFHHACLDDAGLAGRAREMLPVFDCRVFQLPNRTEAANAFLWREKDATKNAIGMAARSFYGPRELHGKSSAEMQEMLVRKGQNFNDYPAFFKRGTFVRRITEDRPLTAEELARIPEKHRPAAGAVVTRSRVVELDMPVFSRVLNREAVIFDGAGPQVAAATPASSPDGPRAIS